MKQKNLIGICAINICVLMNALLHANQNNTFGNNIHNYMWANYNQHNGNTHIANDWYQQLINNNSSVYGYKGYINHLYETSNPEKIVSIMEKTGNTFNNDPDLQLIFVHALQATNNTQKADVLIIKLASQFKTHMEIVFEAAKTYVNRKELENAIQVIDTLLNNTPSKPNFFIFYFLKSQIYTQLNQYEKALENSEKTVSMHPHFDKGWLLFGMLNEQKNKLEKAIEGYTHYLQTTTEDNNEIKQHLLTLTLKAKTLSHTSNIALVNKSCYEKALILFEKKQYTYALDAINTCLDAQNPKTEEQLLKIQILHAMGNHQEAVNAIVHWLHASSKNSSDNNALLNMLHHLALIDAPIALVINAFEQIHQKNPRNLWPTVYLADLYTRENKIETATTYHEKALKLTQDKLLKAKIKFHIGVAHYDKKNFTQMLTALENDNTDLPPFAPSLNLLAYYYATEKKELTKAQALIDKALELSPNNPHFLDTQATIFYKNKEFQKAYDLLKPLAEKTPHDALILIHLAQTQHQLGDAKSALQTVKTARNYTHSMYEKNKANILLQRWSTQ